MKSHNRSSPSFPENSTHHRFLENPFNGMFLITVLSPPRQRVLYKSTSCKRERHPKLYTHGSRHSPLSSPVGNHSPSSRIGGSRVHPVSTWWRVFPVARSSPSHHPPSQHWLGQATVLAMSHASWTAGKGQRAPTFSPFLLFCNHTHLPSTQFGMLQGPRCGVRLRGPEPTAALGRGSMYLNPQELPPAGCPFQALARP